jgi:hypothetical protein
MKCDRSFFVFPNRLQVRSYLLSSFSYALLRLPPFCISLFPFVTELLAHANDDDNTPPVTEFVHTLVRREGGNNEKNREKNTHTLQ